MIEVKINGVVKWQVNEYTFVDPQMGLRSISLTVTHPSDNATVPSFVGAYVEYEGERYDIVNSKPTAEKGIDSINYKYNLIFNGQEAELQKRKIRNLATVGVDTFISQGTSFSLYADINQFKHLLENNLKYYFGNKWTINLGSTTSESVMVSVNNMFIWDLLLKTFEYYGLRWNITGNTINIGYTPDVIQHVFDYGYSGGLVKITRTAQSEPTINRLVGVGGSRNVPFNYFTNRYSDFPVDPNPISGDVNIKNIMPKVFRDSVIAGTLPYIDYVEDAALVAADGVKEDALEPNEEIYPSIAGVEVAGLGRIDQIIAASVPTANTPDDAGYSPTFDIWVKDIGFDLADNQYTATQDAKISFTSGMLAGYEFVILATNGVRNVVVDTSKSYGGVSSKYKITLINSSEDFTATGRMLPNSVIKAMAGDSFVIYDIIMPQTYVELAELRVQNWLNEQLLVKKVEKPTYAIEPTDTFFEENIAPESDGKTIREKLKSGNKLTVNNTKVTDGAQELHINNITIQYGGLLPKYSFVVTDKVSVQGSAIARLTNEIQKTDNSVQGTDKKIAKLQQYSDRQWKEIQETITLLGAAIDGFSTGINPITVQTMQILVGNESLQFRFVNSKTTPVTVSHAFNWDDVLKSFTTTSGIIQHMTLGITEISSNHPVSAYKFWDIASYSNNTLVAEKPYYLYSKCSRTTSGAVFLLSDVPIGMYDDANYYYFLTGILNSEDSNGGRSFVSLYGFTEILPGRITTDKIVSSDGLTYFDLLNGVIGGKIRFASTGGGETSLADWADGTSQDVQDAQAAANAAALAAQQAIDDAAANVGLINTEVGKLQAQIDGEVSNWFYPYSPTLANYPASDWTTNAIKDRHIGDTFTNTQQAPATDAGKSWRFVKNGTVYSWTQIADSDAVLALQKAAQAQSTADGKSTTYLIQPTSYKLGDMWVLAADTTVNGIAYKSGEILTATQDSTTFVQAHWVKRVRYTDDTAVNELQIGGTNLVIKSGLSNSIFSATTGAPTTAAGTLGSGKQPFSASKITINEFTGLHRISVVYFDESQNFITSTWVQDGGNHMTVFPSTRTVPAGTKFISYNIQKLTGAAFPVSEVGAIKTKIEEGDKATAYSESPEDVDAKIADTKLYVEYSTDGISWHTTFQTNDIYMRQKTGVNGTWTGAIKIVGKDGTSVSIKGKVSTSASLPSSASLGDGYIAEDTGHLWVWTGSWTDAGQIQGDNGANSYIHIAYADDSLGAGFSHNPSGKSWIGIYADFTAIDSDTPSDYTWMYAKGQQGDKGDTGASAPLLYLSASAQVMKCNPDNTPQTGQTISIEAKLQNVSGTATFVATPYNDAGTAQPGITLGGTGNTRTLTNAQWLAAYKRIEVVATLGSLNDKVTIYRVADGATGKGISGTEIRYQVGASGTTAPTGTWLTSVPAVPEGQFLWTRTVTSYTDSTSTTIYSVSKQGISGSDGKGISSTVITYQASSSGTVVPTGTWSGTIPSVSENQYLWTRTVITYTDSSTSISYSVGKMGAKGDAGQNAIVGLLTNESVTLQANNAGTVSSFTPANGEFWVYNGTTKVTSGITFSKVSETGCTAAITSAGAYSVSAMSADNATVVLRAIYNGVTIDKVLTLSKSRAGADGVSITLVDVEFAKNTDPDTAPTSGWSTTAPTLTGTEQLWTRTKTTYSAGTPTYSTPANITPKTGATGQGIDSVTEQFILSSSKTIQPAEGDVNWSTTPPPWENGKYIWSRVKVVYKNPTSTVYTGYAVSSEWEAINDLTIGGRNYIIKSQLTNSFFSAVSGSQTFSTSVLGSQKQSFESDQLTVNDFTGLFRMTINYYDINETFLTSTYIQNGNTYIETFPLTTTVPTGTKFISYTIVKKSGGTFPPSESNTLKLKLEKGSKATDWTEAPEDVQAAIDAEKTRINEILSDNIADPSEKQYLSNLWQEIYAEYPRIWAQANTYAVDKSTYEAKYSALNTLLSPVLADLTVNSTVAGASIRTAFSQYYYARTFLLNNITNKVNQNAGDAAAVAADAQAKANISKAVTDKFSGFDGGLATAVIMEMREPSTTTRGDATAGISGIQKDINGNFLPAVWAGGTYAQAIDGLAKAIIKHNGKSKLSDTEITGVINALSGKVGVLTIEESGRVVLTDPDTHAVRLVFSESDIPLIADLVSGANDGDSASNAAQSNITVGYLLPNAITVGKNNSSIAFSASTFTVNANIANMMDYITVNVYLRKNGVNFTTIKSVQLYGPGAKSENTSITYGVDGVGTGTYDVFIEITKTNSADTVSSYISASTLSWTYTQAGIRYFQFGVNGMMAFFSDNHWYFTETGGFDLKGKTNMPGVLAAGSSTSGGAQTNVWGAKSSTAGVTTITSPSAGFRVPLSGLSHSNYVVQITPHTNTTFRVGTKTSTYFEIYGSGGFDYAVIGNNYA